jgi:hypothetical protein
VPPLCASSNSTGRLEDDFEGSAGNKLSDKGSEVFSGSLPLSQKYRNSGGGDGRSLEVATVDAALPPYVLYALPPYSVGVAAAAFQPTGEEYDAPAPYKGFTCSSVGAEPILGGRYGMLPSIL